jgi:hypothetical protein
MPVLIYSNIKKNNLFFIEFENLYLAIFFPFEFLILLLVIILDKQLKINGEKYGI